MPNYTMAEAAKDAEALRLSASYRTRVDLPHWPPGTIDWFRAFRKDIICFSSKGRVIAQYEMLESSLEDALLYLNRIVMGKAPDVPTPEFHLPPKTRSKHNAVRCYMCGKIIKARRAKCCAQKELVAEIDGVTV